MYQGYAPDRWYWELVHIALVLVQLVQLVGVVLWGGAGPVRGGMGFTGGHGPAVSERVMASVSTHKDGTVLGSLRGDTSGLDWGQLQLLDIVSCCGLVATTLGYLFMAGAEAESTASDGRGRGVTCDSRCETAGWLGPALIGLVEAVVWVMFAVGFIKARRQG